MLSGRLARGRRAAAASAPRGSAGCAAAPRQRGCRGRRGGSAGGRWGGVGAFGVDALVALELEGAQDLLDPFQLLVGGLGKPVGVTHEGRHVGAVVVTEGGELTRREQHRVHRVHPRLDEGSQWLPAHGVGHTAAPLVVGQPRWPLHQQVGTEHGDGIVVVGDDDRPEPVPLVVVERRQLVVMVEDPNGPLRHQGAAAAGHAAAGPLGQPGQPHPEGPVDPVVVEPLDALEHDDVRAGPGAHALAEHQHPRAPLRWHAGQPLGDPPQQQAELTAAERDLLHREERRIPCVLDAAGGDVPAGEELGRLDERVVDPAGAGGRDQQQHRPVERPGPFQLGQGQLGPPGLVQGLAVEPDVGPDRMGPCRLAHDLLDQLRGDHVGGEAASLLAEVGERQQAVGAARHQRTGRRGRVGGLDLLVGPPDVGDAGAVGGGRRTSPDAGVDEPGERSFGRARSEVGLQRTPGPGEAPGQPHPDARDHIRGRQRLGHGRRLGQRPPVPGHRLRRTPAHPVQQPGSVHRTAGQRPDAALVGVAMLQPAADVMDDPAGGAVAQQETGGLQRRHPQLVAVPLRHRRQDRPGSPDHRPGRQPRGQGRVGRRQLPGEPLGHAAGRPRRQDPNAHRHPTAPGRPGHQRRPPGVQRRHRLPRSRRRHRHRTQRPGQPARLRPPPTFAKHRRRSNHGISLLALGPGQPAGTLAILPPLPCRHEPSTIGMVLGTLGTSGARSGRGRG